MAYGPKKENDISSKVFKVIKKVWNEDHTRGYEIKVMAWVINGKQREVILAKQELYMNDAGHEMGGKMKGFSAADFCVVLEHASEIANLMAIPPNKIKELMAQDVNAKEPAQTAKASADFEPF